MIIYYINLRSSIISLGISLSYSFAKVSGLYCCALFEIFGILLASLLPIKSPVASVAF